LRMRSAGEEKAEELDRIMPKRSMSSH
jgi:hypothetical protein